jgi:hypothetical protein
MSVRLRILFYQTLLPQQFAHRRTKGNDNSPKEMPLGILPVDLSTGARHLAGHPARRSVLAGAGILPGVPPIEQRTINNDSSITANQQPITNN